jgi:electron transfer flavoprotein alpha/beta subunit
MALTIVACVTSVVDAQQAVEAERGAMSIDEAALPHVLNPADANALEAALRLRDSRPESRVVAVSVGPSLHDIALREAIAQGADEAVRLWDGAFVGSDCLGTARVLAAAARKTQADVIICGDLSLDGSSGVVGAQLAELLGLPLSDAVAAATLTADGDSLLTERHSGGGYRTVERTPLPAVVTVATGTNIPRYPTLRARLQSRSSAVPCWEIAQLGLDPGEVGEAGSALRVTALRRPPPDPRGLVDPNSDLPAEERWMVAISGGVRERESSLIEGSPVELAEQLVRYLKRGSYTRVGG